MQSLRSRKIWHCIESSSLQAMALEVGALPGADSDEGDNISAALGEELEVEGTVGGRVFESHQFPGDDAVAAHQETAPKLFVVVLHRSKEGIRRIAPSSFVRELQVKGYIDRIAHHACPPLTMQDNDEYQQWHVNPSLLRHSVTRCLHEPVDTGADLDEMNFIVMLKDILYRWQRDVARVGDDRRPRDWVLLIRADKLQPCDDSEHLDFLLKALNDATTAAADGARRSFLVVGLSADAVAVGHLDTTLWVNHLEKEQQCCWVHNNEQKSVNVMWNRQQQEWASADDNETLAMLLHPVLAESLAKQKIHTTNLARWVMDNARLIASTTHVPGEHSDDGGMHRDTAGVPLWENVRGYAIGKAVPSIFVRATNQDQSGVPNWRPN
jgi:hypothetical protein